MEECRQKVTPEAPRLSTKREIRSIIENSVYLPIILIIVVVSHKYRLKLTSFNFTFDLIIFVSVWVRRRKKLRRMLIEKFRRKVVFQAFTAVWVENTQSSSENLFSLRREMPGLKDSLWGSFFVQTCANSFEMLKKMYSHSHEFVWNINLLMFSGASSLEFLKCQINLHKLLKFL